MFTESLTPFFADFGVSATLNGAAVTAIVDTQSVVELDDGTISSRPEAQLPSSQATGASAGQSFVASGVSYTVRQVLAEPPDGAVTRLVLVRA